MSSSSPPKPSSFAARLTLLILCIAGLLSPLATLPVTSLSRVPLVVQLCGISLTCAVLLPGCWRRCFFPERAPTRWPQGSRKPGFWRMVSLGAGVSSLALMAASLIFTRPWHRGQINWQSIVAAPGYMLLLWSHLLGAYRKSRLPEGWELEQPNSSGLQSLKLESPMPSASPLQPGTGSQAY